jgi:MFS transporter, DHA3 family, macrolide efflux protein
LYGPDAPSRLIVDNQKEEEMGQSADKQALRTFIIISLGQIISVLGTGLTNFAIGIWVYQQTRSVTDFGLTLLAITLPSIIISPVAGALVDRWDRRWTMFLGDSISALCTLSIALLLYLDSLRVWQVCVIVAVSALASVFHGLALSSSLSLIMPASQLARASGIMQIGPAIAQIASPLLAGVMIAAMPVYWVLIADFATFLFALTTLLMARIPRPSVSAEGSACKGSLVKEVVFGWIYIKARPGILWLLALFAVNNFALAMSNVTLIPMLIGIASIKLVGVITSVASLGMLTGSVVLSVWGGPTRRIFGALGFNVIFGICLAGMGIRPSALLIAIAVFGLVFCAPIISGCSQAILLSKTPSDIQGRVQAVVAMLAWSAAPLAYLIAGPLVDRFFEPLLAQDGPLAGGVGRIIGVGTGRGIGLLIILLGIGVVIASVAGYLNPRLRLVEDELPDAIPLSQPDAVQKETDGVAADKSAASD